MGVRALDHCARSVGDVIETVAFGHAVGALVAASIFASLLAHFLAPLDLFIHRDAAMDFVVLRAASTSCLFGG